MAGGRPRINLRKDRGLEPETIARRAAAYERFLSYLTPEARAVVEQGRDAEFIDECLADYGQHLYNTDTSGPSKFKGAIQGCTDRHRRLRRSLVICWDSHNAWEAVEPSENRTPVPMLVMRALIAVAIAWGWVEIAASLAMGFHAGLRPGEILAQLCSNILLPEFLLHGLLHGFVIILTPKTRKHAARRQHARLEGRGLLSLIRSALAGRSGDSYLWTWYGSPAVRARRFRKCWDHLCAAVGVDGLLPSGIRPGAITWWYDQGLPLERIRWIGRWTNVHTMERYVQELAAVRVLSRLPATVLARIAELAAGLDALITVLDRPSR